MSLSSLPVQSGEDQGKSSECDKFSVVFLSSLDKTINPTIMGAIEQGLIEARLTSVAPSKATGIAMVQKGTPPKDIGFSGPVYLGHRRRSGVLSQTRRAVRPSGKPRTQTVMNRFFLVHDIFLEENYGRFF